MVKRRAYWITSFFATLVYILILFSLWVSVPIGSKREWLMVLLLCLVLLAVPLILAMWGFRNETSIVQMGHGAQILCAVVLLERITATSAFANLFSDNISPQRPHGQKGCSDTSFLYFLPANYCDGLTAKVNKIDFQL